MMTQEEKILFCDHITVLENDIRRATLHLKQATEQYFNAPTEVNHGILSTYQRILDNLENKLQELEK